MSKKDVLQLAALAAMFASGAQDYFHTNRRTHVEPSASQEDIARRERCAKIAIEKAKQKRERKAAKRAKNQK